MQDEAITTLVFLLPLFIFVLGRFKTAALVDTVGIWTKFFNGVIYLVLLIKAPTRKDALKMFGITALITSAVAVPFLIIAPDKFLSFPAYYFLQDKNAQTGGMSMWHFWDLGGFTLPGTIGVIMTLVAVLGAATMSTASGTPPPSGRGASSSCWRSSSSTPRYTWATT